MTTPAPLDVLARSSASLSQRTRRLLLAAAVVALLVLFSWQAQERFLSHEWIRGVIAFAGPFAPLAVVLLHASTVVFSPLSGGPIIVVIAFAYGVWAAFLTAYAGNLLGSTLAFAVARLAGRPLLQRLVGAASLRRLDEIAEITGVQTLIVLRLVGGGLFDLVSYAAGLTRMRFRIYFLITNTVSIPAVGLLVYMIDRAIQLPPLYTAVIGVLIALITIVFPLLVYRWQRRVYDARERDWRSIAERGS